VRIDVPPLRERKDDIGALARLAAAEVAARLGRPSPAIPPETLARLRAYPWPGNVRELRSVIERAMILDPAHALENLDLLPAPAPAASMPESSPAGGELNLREALTRLERDLLLEAQRRSGGVRKDAAHLLGIDPRNLAYYLRKHGLGDAAEEG
jgi:DNA-binding NtrC family response regulator